MSNIETIKQDSRADVPTTGREGDAPSAPAVNRAPTTGLDKKGIDARQERERSERVPTASAGEATAHRAVREAVQGTESAGQKWLIAADAIKVHYKTLQRAEKARVTIFAWMTEGLPKDDQRVLAVAKKDLKTMNEADKAIRKNAGSKLSTYYARMIGYAFPKAVAKAREKAKGEGSSKGKDKESKSVNERALALVTAALEYLKKNEGFSFDAIKAVTHLAAAKQIMGENKKA